MAGFRCPNCETAQQLNEAERAAGRVVCRSCGATISLAVQDPLGADIDLPAPKARHQEIDLPAPKGLAPAGVPDVENLPAPVARHRQPHQNLPAPKAPGGPPPLPPSPRGMDNLPAPKGGPGALPDLLAPVGGASPPPVPSSPYDNLPAPVGQHGASNLPAPKGFFDDSVAPRGGGPALPASPADLPAPKGYFEDGLAPQGGGGFTGGGDLPAPKGFFEDGLAPQGGGGFTGGGDLPAPKGFFEDGLAPQGHGGGPGGGSLPAPKGFFDGLAPQGAAGPGGSLPAPKGFFDDAVAPHGGDPMGGADLPAPKGIFDDLAPPSTSTLGGGGGGAPIDLGAPLGGAPAEPFDLGEPLDLGGLGGLGGGPASPGAPGGAPAPLDLGAPVSSGASALDLDDLDLAGPSSGEPPALELSTGNTAPPPMDLGGGAQRPFGLDDLELEAANSDMSGGAASSYDELALPTAQPPGGAAPESSDGVVSFSQPSESAVAAGQKALARRRPVEDGPLELDDSPLPGTDVQTGAPTRRTMAGDRAKAASLAPPPAKKKKVVLIAAAVLGVAVLGGGGYYGYSQYASGKATEEAVSRAQTRARDALVADRPGHWAEAAKAAQTAINADKKNADSHALSAQAYFGSVIDEGLNTQANTNLGKKATGVLRQLAAKGPEVFKADALQALVERRADIALQKLNQARQANRRDASLDLYFGWAYMLGQDFKNAESSFTAALASSPDRVSALYGLAQAQQAQNKFEEAQATYLKTIEKSRERYKQDHVGALVGAAQLADIERYTDRENRYLEILARGDLANADPRALSRAWTLAGDEALRAGRVQEANQRYGKALELDPQNIAAVVGEGNTLLALGRLSAARERLTQVLNVAPNDLDASLALAEVALLEENLTEAKQLLNAIFERKPPIESKPILARAHRILAGALALEPNSDDEAEAEFREAIKLSGPRDTTASLALARFYVDRKRGEEARAVLDPLLAKAAEDPSIAVSLGVAYLGAKDATSAERSFRLALTKRPSDVEARFQLGQALLAQSRYDEGLAAIKAAYDRNPAREDIGLALAVAYEDRKRFSDAIALYESLLGAEEPSLNVRARAGRYFARHGNEARAIALGEEILAQQPNNPAGLFLLGEKYFAENKFDKAQSSYDEATSLDKQAQYFEGAARARERLQLFDDALIKYEKTVELDSEYLSAYLGMARIYMARRSFLESIKVLEKALELDPKSAWAHYAMGTSYLELRKLEPATKSLSRAVKLDDSLLEAHYRLGRAYYDLDKTRPAAVALTRATAKANGEEEWLTEAYRLSGYAHKQSGNRRAAIAAFRSYFDRNPLKGPVRADAKRELLYLEGGGR